MTQTSAAIWNDPEWSGVALVERRRWRIQLSLGPDRRKLTATRREAIEYCQEHDIPFIVVDRPERDS